MTEQEKELRAALEAATPGPWTASNRGAYSVGGEDEGSVYGPDGEDTGAEFVRPVGDAPTIRGEMWFRDAHFIALARNVLPALLAEVEALRIKADRYDWLCANVKEEPLRPAAYGSEIAPDMRLKHSFPVLVSYDAIGQQISLDAAIDAARSSSALTRMNEIDQKMGEQP